MKKHLLFLVLLFAIKGFSQTITVAPAPNANTGLTQWVNDRLVNNACLAQTANATKIGFDTYGGGASIGSFQNTNPNFPFASGVVLSSGTIARAPGPNTTVSSDESLAWLGDADASAVLGMNSINATVLEFDFVAVTNSLSIDYIFASEEYGQFQCKSKDGFAILLSSNGGPYTNIARTGGTPDSAVSVATIHSSLYNNTCSVPDIHPELFGQFNGGGNAAASPTNYEGQTIVMNASAVLVVGQTYHIKIVIADDGNANDAVSGTEGKYDSAVFLPSGGFNLGQEVVGENITLDDNNALCQGDTYQIRTGLIAADYTSLTWTRGGTQVGSGPDIDITQSGTYTLTIVTPNGCTVSEDVVVQFAPQIVPGTPQNLYACENNGGNYTFNLALNTSRLKEGLDPLTIVTYHISADNANTGQSALNTTYTGAANQTIYARVKSNNSSCFVVVPFDILSVPAPTATAPATYTLCESTQGAGTATFNLTSQTGTVLGNQPSNQFTVQYYSSLNNATNNISAISPAGSFVSGNRTIYVRVQSNLNSTCFTVTSFAIAVTPLPAVPELADVNACSSYTLQPLANGVNYYTSTGGRGTQLAAGTVISATQTVYLYATSGTCSAQTDFIINIASPVTTPANVTSCTSYTLPFLPAGQEYRTAANGGGNLIIGGTAITTTQTIYFYVPSASGCTGSSSFTVTIITADDPADVNSCTPYTLPALTSGSYYSQRNARGIQFNAGDVISATRNVYVYKTLPGAPCAIDNEVRITITNTNIDPVAPVINSCGPYVLPGLTAGRYFTGPGGTGTVLPAGRTLNTSRQVYIYAAVPGVPSCTQEVSFQVNVFPVPTLAAQQDVTVCTNYTLPNLGAGVVYYTENNAMGTLYNPGDVLTETTTLYATTAANANGCRGIRRFKVIIIGNTIETPGNRNVCDNYPLPLLEAGEYYNGTNGTGGQIPAGTLITENKTIYVYLTNGTCNVQDSFTVTVRPLPVVNVQDVASCSPYTLPSLSGVAYYTQPNRGSAALPANYVVSATQTLYAYSESGGTPNCIVDKEFTVSILSNSIAPANVASCGPYVLPELPLGEYRTARNGGGTLLAPGSTVSTSQTIFVYTPTVGTNCTADNSFVVSINSVNPVADPANATACNGYQLPRITNGHYYLFPGGSANGNAPLPDDYIVRETRFIFVHNDNVNCPSQHAALITIYRVEVDNISNQDVCANEGYALPSLATGKYYTMSGGPAVAGNTEIVAGTVINTPQTIYIYASIPGTTPLCFDEKSFTITVAPSPVVDTRTPAASCGQYVLPSLSPGNRYFTESGAGGTEYFAGQIINSTQTLYIFTQNTTPPFCSAESEFTILVDPEAPQDVTECDNYTLPALPPGQFYYTGPGGPVAGNTQIPSDGSANISATQDIYFYIPTAAACTANTFFTVTINNTPILDAVPSPGPVCDSYTLPAITVGNYYTATGGPAGGGTVLDPNVPLTTSQTVYIYAETATSPNCFSEAAFAVNITQTPLVEQRSNVNECFRYFLTPLTVGTYYALSGGPSEPGQQAIDIAQPITTNRTIYIYAESPDNPLCFAENSFTVTIYTVRADTILPAGETSIERCDSFTLPVISLGNNDYTQKYYKLQGGPDVAGQEELNAGDIITQSTTVYIYAELAGRTLLPCFEEVAIPINIYPTPVVAAIDGVEACFTYTLPALPVTSGVTYNYYTLTGGPSGGGAILPEGSAIEASGNSTTRQEVFLYAYTGAPNTDLCHDEESFVVNVHSIDVPDFDDVVACDTYTLPALPVGNYFTAQNGGGTPLFAGDVINTIGVTPIYIYGVTQTTPACTDESTFNVDVVPRPTGIVPQPLHACAVDDNNNQGIFDLTPALTEALNNQVNVEATVFETLEDAQFNVRPITGGRLTAYPSLPAVTQTLYIRLASTRTGLECYTIVTLRLIVDPRPVAIEPTQPYSICDNGVSDTDGIGVFDLTTYESRVLGTLNPAQFDVAYYTDAAATNEIINPGTFESTGQTVYIRVFNIATGCDDIVELELIVNPMPAVVTPTPYTLCDETTVGNRPDEKEVFDLTTKITEITNGANGLNVTFYTSFENADTANNAISDADSRAYTNLTTVQTLFVRVEDAMSGCYRIVLMDLRVEPLPTLLMPTADDRTICDSDGNGYGEINLADLVQDMIDNGGANIVVRFYMTAIGAENNNPNSVITNLEDFRNQNPGMGQTIYVRAENTITGCFSQVYPLELIFNAAPLLPVAPLEPLPGCDDDRDQDDQDGITAFDLTAYEAAIRARNPVNGTSLVITYHVSQAEAEAGSPIIISPTAYLGSDAQVIWIRVENPATECYTVTSFELQVDMPVDVAQPTALVKCDYEQPAATPPNAANNQSYVFDLTEKDAEILGATGQGQDNVVTYYVTEDDVTSNNPITDPTAYRNLPGVNPQTLQVVVTTISGCRSYTTLTIKVLPLPDPNPTPDPLEECEDLAVGENMARFNLTDANADILQQSTLTTLTYWELASDAEAGTGTPLPLSYESESKIIYVRAELAGSEPGDPVCAVVVPLELIVNPLPATEIAPYGICQTNFTGFAQFDLGNYRSTILPAGAVQSDYIVRFYARDPRVVPPGSGNGNPTLPFLYTNIQYQQQTIYVYAQNIETRCDVVLELILSVEPQTIANPVDDTVIRECDDDGINDGITAVDLTEAKAVIVGTQGPIDNYDVTYYLTEADARADQNAITGDLTNYVTSTTILWAMVKNNQYPFGCPAYTQVPVTIDLLPEPVITSLNDSHTSCVDFVTNEVLRYVELSSNITAADNTFQWFKDGVAIPGATSANYNAYETGIYTVVVTGGAPNFCVSDAIPGWDVTLSGPASLIGDGYVVSNAFADNQVITVLVEGYGDYQYSMYVDGPWQNSNVFTNVTTGYHDIYVRDITNGNDACDPITLSDVSTIDYPKYFTPNGDGYNDYWNIIGLANFPSSRIYIFDKYGKLLKQLAPGSNPEEGQGWDGTFNGNPLPSDDYWFTVTFPDGDTVREFKAHFAMKR